MRKFCYCFLGIMSLVLVISGASCEKVTTTITVSPPSTTTFSQTAQTTVTTEYPMVDKSAVFVKEDPFLNPTGQTTYQLSIDISNKFNNVINGYFLSGSDGLGGGYKEINLFIYDNTNTGFSSAVPNKPIFACGPLTTDTFSFVPDHSGIYYFRFVVGGTIRNVVQFTLNWNWQEKGTAASVPTATPTHTLQRVYP